MILVNSYYRYLIVIDDIWSKDACKTVKYALCKNNKDSKIITTTRMHDVAEACCSSDADFVYRMKPLSFANSKKLFFQRLFGSFGKCPDYLKDVSYKISGNVMVYLWLSFPYLVYLPINHRQRLNGIECRTLLVVGSENMLKA